MTTTNPIAAYLKTYHKGAERVVSSRELEAAFQIRGPDLRRLIKMCIRDRYQGERGEIMSVNAMTEEYEHIELFGKPALFTKDVYKRQA